MKPRPSKPNKQSHEILRGTFSGDELERLLWEVSWVDWKPQNLKHGRWKRKCLSLFDTTVVLHAALQKLLHLMHVKSGHLSAWLELHSEGDWTKIPAVSANNMIMLSLSQFRGGRTYCGDFKGYINPGEILTVRSISPKGPYQVDKVSSGERVILCLAQRSS